MGIKQFFERLSTPESERARQDLFALVAETDVTPLDEITLRTTQHVLGEIESVRVVPRANADAVEATISDGTGLVTLVFLGRRRIPGISPGRRLIAEGVPAKSGMRVLMYNPRYTLLTAR